MIAARLQSTLRFASLVSGFIFAMQQADAKGLDVISLQPLRTDTILDLSTKDKSVAGFVRLINLNPQINVWYVLEVTWPGESKSHTYHLENPAPENRLVYLDSSFPNGLRILNKTQNELCELWSDGKPSQLLTSEKARKTYSPICNDLLYVRYETEGSETTKEFVADFLRSHVWGGDQITTIVKDYLYKDKFLLTAANDTPATAEDQPLPSLKPRSSKFPDVAKIAESKKGLGIEPKELGITVNEIQQGKMLAGQWYQSTIRKDVYVSAIQASALDPAIFETYKDRVQKLDPIESNALVYMVAFDLEHFDLGFAMGTKHPSPEWSERAPEKVRSSSKPGPDGIKDFSPLNMTGKVNPEIAPRTIATFTGGFKRTHGAFKWGKLAMVNQGSHYGFMENGVIFSTLQPDLATVIIYKDGTVDMKTWRKEDERDLPKIRHARQNGVPLIDYNPDTKESYPGSLVSNWTNGNWSGSVDSKQRALRAGACLVVDKDKKFLLYGYFSSVTPNAMARIFQGYGCQYALHLDMNALEHTYLALYQQGQQQFQIQHLIEGMNVLDRKTKEQVVPRFVGTADNRDFFYVVEKN